MTGKCLWGKLTVYCLTLIINSIILKGKYNFSCPYHLSNNLF